MGDWAELLTFTPSSLRRGDIALSSGDKQVRPGVSPPCTGLLTREAARAPLSPRTVPGAQPEVFLSFECSWHTCACPPSLLVTRACPPSLLATVSSGQSSCAITSQSTGRAPQGQGQGAPRRCYLGEGLEHELGDPSDTQNCVIVKS